MEKITIFFMIFIGTITPLFMSNTLLVSILIFTHINQRHIKYTKQITTFLLTQIPLISYILKNILFNILFFLMIPLYSLIGSIIILISKYIYTINYYEMHKILAKHLLFLCSHLLNIKVEIIGPIPKNALIASQHQSELEVIILSALLPDTTFMFKDSLLYIPFFGYCMKNLEMIPVSRTAKNLHWLQQATQNLNNKKNVIIFPEGRRTYYEEKAPYLRGVFDIAKYNNQKIIPVYIDTGLFWPKNAFFKNMGTTTIYFGDPINPSTEELEKAFQKMKLEIGKSY